MLTQRISVIVDGGYGSQIEGQAALGPVWVVRSPANQRVMETLWAGSRYEGDHLTIFNGGDGTPEDVALEILGAVDLHHPKWATIELIGVPPTPGLTHALGEYGDGSIEATPNGFTFSREV